MNIYLNGCWVIVMSSLFLTGCVHTSIVLKNGTEDTITVVSCHSKETVKIEKGKAGELPHTEGNIIALSNDEEWIYKNISILEVKQNKKKPYVYKYSRYIFWTGFKMDLLIDKNKKLFISLPSETKLPSQPNGYPKRPIFIKEKKQEVEEPIKHPVLISAPKE